MSVPSAVGPGARGAREPGQGLTAAAISGVNRGSGVLAADGIDKPFSDHPPPTHTGLLPDAVELHLAQAPGHALGRQHEFAAFERSRRR